MSRLGKEELAALNLQLKVDRPWGHYTWVKVLVIYWEGTDASSLGFRQEANEVVQLFRDLFRYDVQEFAIPLTCSTRRMRQCILSVLNEAEDLHTTGHGPCLLILHYGGHGDRDDDHHNGQERRAVWAASSSADSALLEWHDVQKELEDVSTDVVLLLDCCFAAQAARHRSNARGRIEMLAAAAMGVKTAWPGESSFTNALLRTMRQQITDSGYVTISTLATDLSNKDLNLETPVHLVLKHGFTDNTIKLIPFEREIRVMGPDSSASSTLRLLAMGSKDLKLDEVVFWLRSNMPRDISFLQVEEVLRTTNTIQEIMLDKSGKEEPPIQNLANFDLNSLFATWSAVRSLLMEIKHLSTDSSPPTDHRTDRLTSLLQNLKDTNTKLVSDLEQKILQASQTHHDQSLEKLIDDPRLQVLGITDQLQLRRMISKNATDYHLEDLEMPDMFVDNKYIASYVEFKEYGEYLNPAHLPIIENRVRMLAELLNARKSSEFLAMNCAKWYHEPHKHRFVLEFDVAAKYRDDQGHCTSISLTEIIRRFGGRKRPSLGQRFSIARKLATALKKWHMLGWVHQSISSHNVIFFHKLTGQVDYDSPFLQGFDFARPSQSSSILSYVDNVEFNIYRHRNRQGSLRDGHRKIHDMYSLGVVLLELGLWEVALMTAGVSCDLNIREPSVDQIRAKLQSATANRLAHYAGVDFQEAVQTCLTGNFNVEEDDSAESRLANAYQKQVVEKLCKSEMLR